MLPSYRVQVVTGRGAVVLESGVSGAPAQVSLPRALPPGKYWIRISEPGPGQGLLREFGLEVR